MLLLLAAFSGFGQSFQSFINRLNTLPVNERQAVADSFLNAGHSFPYCEYDTLVHFIYTADATTVAIAGDQTGWNPLLVLTRITGTTFWYYTAHYPADARLDYKFVINGSNWILDPRNPHTCTGGFGPNSELGMPGYVHPPEIDFYNNIPHGTIKDTTFHSNILENSRPVRIYLPPGYPSGLKAYPVILFHDGPEYISLGSTNNILDYLISEHQIAPVIGIFVPPVDRTAEYAGNKIDNFTQFIITELMPVIDAGYKTNRDPARRAMCGASDGGNISLYIGMKHPEQFGKISAQSSDVITAISQTLANGPKLNLEFHLDIGKYDITVLIPMVNNLIQILTDKNYILSHYQWNEGHSWGNWKGHLRLPLLQFFPISSGLNENSSNPGLKLEQIQPNPFRDTTQIKFSAHVGASVNLILYDVNGRKLETFYSGKMESPSATTLLINHGYPPGVYIISIETEGQHASQKINIIK